MSKPNAKGVTSNLASADKSISDNQFELLLAIQGSGSISAAAKQVGVSYKTAWDRIEALNNMSPTALVSRSAGGSKGGGTALTDIGISIVNGYKALQNEQKLFIQEMGGQPESLQDYANFSSTDSAKIRSQNQLLGVITAKHEGRTESEISVDLGAFTEIIVTLKSSTPDQKNHNVGDQVLLRVKPSSIIISTDRRIRTSARNNLRGKIVRLLKGEVNTEVIIDIGNEKTMCSVITDISVKELELSVGTEVVALFKASSVTLLPH